ncbi:MAG TPA: hypothetical protein VLX30_11775 [Burkholderiales bacterium]|nr:hypothetical protein [Burkholderiales bacterium]
MRYLVLASLMFALGVVVDTLEVGQRMYFPVVRLRTSEGFFITAVQARTDDARRCSEATERFVAPIRRLCPTCVVESQDCDSILYGFEKALAEGAAVPLYTVSAGGVRLALVGPPGGAKASCEAIAQQMVLSGAPSASCVFPGVDPAPAGPAR